METLKSETGLQIAIDSLGAQLLSLCSIDGIEYIWQGDKRYWTRHAPILFPFVARLAKGVYTYKGNTYPMETHGFISRVMFKIEKNKEENQAVCIFTANEETKKNYPFNFTFTVIYTLQGNTLDITYIVKNKGKETLFYGIGSHPGFSVPLNKKLQFEDYYLEFPQATHIQRRIFTEDCLDTGKEEPFLLDRNQRLPLKHSLFDNDAIILFHTGGCAQLKSDKDSHSLTITYPQTPICALWHTVGTQAPFLCIEPWCSLPSQNNVIKLESKSDFFCLKEKEERSHSLSILTT